MINWNDKIRFVEGFTNYDVENPGILNEFIELSNAFGLELLEKFLRDNSMICVWYGSRKDLLAFYAYRVANYRNDFNTTELMHICKLIGFKEKEEP